jgi:ABC-type multidrug transport system fused ATPase/permease subunit
LTTGDFVMVVGYAVAVTTPFTTLAVSLSEIRKSHLALNEGFDMLQLPVETGAKVAGFDRASPDVLCIEGVDVQVAGDTILRDVNLRAERNRLTAIVGPSAAGKSSIANLALGLLRPATGKIRVLGIDIRDIAVCAIAKEIGLVPQNPLILSGTLRENLVFGCEVAPDDVFLKDIVSDLELTSLGRRANDILDEPLGIQGRTLSGGERQRIALGRALARCPGVLILDEPTSSLDPAREERILERIRRRVPTIIVITHRDALWKAADRIYEVGSGCVRERGAIDAEQPFLQG